MISFACPACNKPLKVKDELAGKKIKCPACAKILPVPGNVELRTMGAPTPSAQEMPTLAPTLDQPPARDMTVPPPGLSELTRSPHPDASQHDSSLTDFLAPPQADDELGRLGGFRILKILGHGGMGVVFQGEDPKLGRKVAIKAMLPDIAESKSAQQRFLREARAAAALEHDHIVPILQVGEERGAPFIVMPFLQGEPLDRRLEQEQRLPLAEVLRIGRQTALGLAAAHKKGLIHRDIKPANIWLEAETGRVKILDFGLARASAGESGLTQQGAIIGTPAYMAPEQGAGEKVDARCDLFSLGCVLYRLCTGEMPFKGKDTVSTIVAVAMDNPKSPAEINPDVPAELSDLVMRLLAKKPEDRPASAEVVVESLQEIEALTAEGTARPKTKIRNVKAAGTNRMEATRSYAGQSARKRPRLPWLVGGGVLGLGVVAAAIVLFWPTPRGLVKIESDDPTVEIVFDQTGPTVKGADKEPISLRAGEHGVLIKRGDFEFEADKFLLKKGQTITLKLEWLPGKVQVVQDGKVIAFHAVPPPATFTNSIGMKFVWIPPGTFMMGSPKQEIGRQPEGGGDETQHKVTLTKGFYMSVYTVTQEEWQAVIGINSSFFKGEKNLPVEKVSWEECQDFIEKLREKDKKAYRLPTEAEWEYACRAGTTTPFFFGETISTDQANYNGESYGNGKKGVKRGKTTPVDTFPANAWGLHDMSGNVNQWCQDWYGDHPANDVVDPQGPEKGEKRVLRSGAWSLIPEYCRSANRGWVEPGYRSYSIGFRLCFFVEEDGIHPPKNNIPKKAEAPPPAFKNSIGMEFVLVPKGKSWLGGGAGKPADKEVEIQQDFYLGKYEVTQEEWGKVMGSIPSYFSSVGAGKETVKAIPDAELKRFPVEMVSWDDARLFVEALNKRDKEAGWLYRLPKEVEWEYACRGGPGDGTARNSAFDYYFDKPTNQLLPEQANFEHGKGWKRTCKVGSYQPNRLGLYDMHGNVWEWCEDPFDEKSRVGRGGDWGNSPLQCRAASRDWFTPSKQYRGLGLRLARVPIGKEVVASAKPESLDAWIKEVAALPTEKQVEAVAAKLKERNPGFDGKVTHKIEAGAVIELTFRTDNVTDISPVRALTRLKRLSCSGTVIEARPAGSLADLTPLKGMALTFLGCQFTKVADLAPLQGMPLRGLHLAGTQVSDLAPLKGMPLRILLCDFKPERDTAILRSIKTLEKINDKPAAEFWKEVDAKAPDKKP